MNSEIYDYYCNCVNNLPVNKSIAFLESHNSMDFAGNMMAIAKELSCNEEFENIKIRISVLPENREKILDMINEYGIKYEKIVIKETMEYFETLATAGYLFSDVSYYPLFQKKNGQTCVYAWHGTPLKTLGFTFTEDAYIAANQKRGFTLADYVISPNAYTWECFKNSYELNGLFKGKVVFNGYPRNSIFFDEDRRTYMQKALNPDNKKIIVFMPTWRGKVISIDGESQSQELQEILGHIDELLPDDYLFWAKLHRLNSNELDFSEFKHIKPFPEGYETYDVLNIADVLVTDYSSVMFDFSNTKKKIILYCYDNKKYIEERGVYFDIAELPFPIVTNEEDLIKELSSGKNYNDENFLKRFNEFDGYYSTRNLCMDILKGGHNCTVIELEREKEKKALLFVGDLGRHRATDSFFLEELDKLNEQYSCYITYLNHLFATSKWYKLLQLSTMNKMPMYKFDGRYAYYTKSEEVIITRIRNSIAKGEVVDNRDWNMSDEIGRREYARFYYNNSFDSFIRYDGRDLESLKWFRIFKGEKIIYIHETMMEKAEMNLEYRIYLHRAMQVAHEIRYANQDVFKRAEEIHAGLKNKKLILDLY